jgi:hypothetical protein
MIVRYMLMPPSERNGLEPMAEIDHYTPNMAEPIDHWTKVNCGITGIVRVSYVLVVVITYINKWII